MSRGVSRTFLIGNVGKDPEVKYTPEGKAVGNFSLATSYGSKGNEKTEWHRIVVWERLAEVANEYMQKGSKVYVEGRIQSRKYTDNQGVERTVYEIVASSIELLGGQKEKAATGAAAGDWEEDTF